MKAILIIIALFGLASCKSMEVKYSDPSTNGECMVKYKGWGRSDLKDMSANICGGTLNVGSSSTDTPTGMSAEQLVCIMYGRCGE